MLDLPGGMRIGTIHAFCQSLLRRFPLEASLSPHFRLVDDRDAEDALTEARENMLAHASSPAMRAALETLAGLASADQFGRHVAALQADLPRLQDALDLGEALEAAQRRALGVTAKTEADIIASAMNWQAEPDAARGGADRPATGREAMRRTRRPHPRLARPGSGGPRRALAALVRGVPHQGRQAARAERASSARRCSTRIPTMPASSSTECDRILEAIDACLALRVAAMSAALMTLAAPVLHAYAEHKEGAGLLDYDDLIGRTSNLLVDPGAAWVLYKLDGGLDHLLLDEVQDTAPAQWRIAHALTAEFFAGEGARDTERTVFAVGDRKQSIYSFQGADIEEFDRSHRLLRERVAAAGKPWRGRKAGCVVPLDPAGAGAGGSGVRQSARRRRRGRCRRDADPLRGPRGPCRRGGTLAARPRCPMRPNRCRGRCRSRTTA